MSDLAGPRTLAEGAHRLAAIAAPPGHPAGIASTDGDPAADRLTPRDLWSSAQTPDRGNA